MTVVAASDLQSGQELTSEVCIVGAGPAGLVLAAELAAAGVDVCLVESGVEKLNEVAQDLNRIESVGHQLRENFVNRLRMLGGASNIWAGRCMPLQQIDFDRRPHVANSGWPFSYAEIHPFASRAAAIMGLPRRFLPDPADGSAAPALGGQHVMHGFDHTVALWAKSPPNFWRMFRRRLRASPKCRLVRGLSVNDVNLNPAGTAVSSLSARPTPLSETDARARSVDEGVTLRAKRFVIAAGGIETTRLMLLADAASPHAQWPKDALGRYYMDHPRAVFGTIKLNENVDFSAYLGRPTLDGRVQICPTLSRATQYERGLLNPYFYFEQSVSDITAETYDAAIGIMSRIMRRGHVGKRFDFSNMSSIKDRIYQLTPSEILPHNMYTVYFNLRSLIKTHSRRLEIVNHCEQVPNPESRITLGSQTDYFNNPVPRIDWRISDLEIESIRAFHRALGKYLETHRIGTLASDPDAIAATMFFDSSHHLGGTRMGTDSSTSVVDEDLKVHGIENLYLCSTSTFPTGGSANPTWFLTALALRLHEHLVASTRRIARDMRRSTVC